MSDQSISIGVYGAPTLVSRHLPALASLPLTFAAPTREPAMVGLVGPDHESIAAAVRARPKVIVLDDLAETTGDSRKLLREAGLAVLPVLPLGSLLAPFVSRVPRQGMALARSNLRATGSSRAAKLSHLSVLQMLVGELQDLAIVHEGATSYSGRAMVADSRTPVFWTGQVLATEDRFDLDCIGTVRRLEIDARAAQAAIPPRVQWADKDGLRVLPATHESGLRLLWRHAADLASGKAAAAPPPSFDLLDNSPIFN